MLRLFVNICSNQITIFPLNNHCESCGKLRFFDKYCFLNRTQMITFYDNIPYNSLMSVFWCPWADLVLNKVTTLLKKAG